MAENTIIRPLLVLRGLVVFPGMIVNVDIGREKSMHAVDAVMKGDKHILLSAQKNAAVTDVTVEDINVYGVLAEIKQFLKLPNGTYRILIEGKFRIRYADMWVDNTNQETFVGAGIPLKDQLLDELEPQEQLEAESLKRLLVNSFEKWGFASKKVNQEAIQSVKDKAEPGAMADLIAGYLTVNDVKKQTILSCTTVIERMRKLYELLVAEIEVSELARKISEDVHQQVEKNQKEYYLREQIKAISKELGEAEDVQNEVLAFRERMAELTLPADVEAKLNKELNRLLKMPPMTPDGAVIRAYVDTVLSLPWGIIAEENYDLQLAEKVLERDHYGLKKVKERILEHLAVRSLTNSNKGPILCLVGPPGVGKTSLAHSIAEAVGRTYIRLSLGGVRDEAEIRGHRRTYIGSMPGRIIRGLQNCSCMNPVFLLDEVDKLASDFRGDPAAALLEALDPEQNHSFSDHFIEVPFDLSKVFWIVTANTNETIPPALLDRMEVIQLTSYTEEEKLEIAKRHLLPKLRRENGLENYRVVITEKAIRRVIRDYTREAGVRNLERKLAAICRKIAFKITKGECKGARIDERNLEKFLGPVIFLEDDMELKGAVGVVNGLAWTAVGGELLKVEVVTCKGKGGFVLTGQLGDVMKESATAGFTYVRSIADQLGIDSEIFETRDLHIHLPEGAVPKDGPSAGVTMITAMVSALTGKPVRDKLAMTGEISLTGKVLPVGGIKEKMLAAHRYGIKTILLPKANMQDLEELTETVKSEMEFIPVKTVDEVLKLALGIELKV